MDASLVCLERLHLNAWPIDTKLANQAADQGAQQHPRARQRQPRPISDYTAIIRERNEELAKVRCAPLTDEEFYAARMYTGPMFIKYNGTLRGVVDGAPPTFKSDFDKLCQGNMYHASTPPHPPKRLPTSTRSRHDAAATPPHQPPLSLPKEPPTGTRQRCTPSIPPS